MYSVENDMLMRAVLVLDNFYGHLNAENSKTDEENHSGY